MLRVPPGAAAMNRTLIVAFLIFSLASTAAHANNDMVVGDGRIDGTKAKEYDLTWRQCSLQGEAWVRGADLSESLTVTGPDELSLRQVTHRDGGITVEASSNYDRKSFAPLQLEQTATSGDGDQLAHSIHRLTADGYEGHVNRGGESKDVSGDVSSHMLHGGAMGLPLALLPYQDTPLKFNASMIAFDASYTVTAEWAGSETIEYEGEAVDVWFVDIEWLHEGLGDIYPPGPDASGGRYWVAHNPPAGFPYVLRYKTDTYAIEFLPLACPD